ncbi:MAG: uroporphyrinogen-III synthase [Anaerolineales bacterium]|nr:uroporphyrinogen-III synthase [Anaerolineales bacterium]
MMNLAQKRILITRPQEQSTEFIEALKSAGAEPVLFPVFEIAPLRDFTNFDSALRAHNEFDWIIFTSVHSVHAFFKRLKRLEISLAEKIKIAVIGSKTARGLETYGRTPDFIPAKYLAEEIIFGLEPVAGKRFLLLQSNLSARTLAEVIQRDGGEVLELVAYQNMPRLPDESALRALQAGVDVITFTSPSSAQNLRAVLEKYNLPTPDALVACIGPVTAKAAREAGFVVSVEAKEHTLDGLFQALNG